MPRTLLRPGLGCVHCGQDARHFCAVCGDSICDRCKVLVKRKLLCQVCSPVTSSNQQVFYLGNRKRF